MTADSPGAPGLPPVPGERWYRILLRLYPRAFRDRYGESMAEFFRDRRALIGDNRTGVRRFWMRLLFDIALTAPREHVVSLVERRDTPRRHDHSSEKESMVASTLQDLRYAVRGIIARPAFATVVIATLALGVGANVAIFSVVNGILLRPLPYREPGRIISFTHEDPLFTVSEPEFKDYRTGVTAFSRIAAWTMADANIFAEDEPQKVSMARVSDGFFQILGVAPLQGRTFAPEEDLPNGPRVIIISYGLWKSAMDEDAHAVGKSLMLNGNPRTVIGVMPEGFDFPTPATAMWVPLQLNPDSLWTRNNHYLRLVARLAPGAPLTKARAQAAALDLQWVSDYPETYQKGKPAVPVLTPIRETFVGTTRPYLFALLGAVGFVLLVACVNVANLLLARGETRRRELAIRTALGASGRRLVTQLLTESSLLGICGGALGLGIAVLGERALIALAPNSIPRLNEVRVDGAVLAFTLVVSLATGVLFGLMPAFRASRGNSAGSLKDGGRTSLHHGATRRARQALVISEVALAAAMLTGSGVLLRSLWKLQATDLGFDSSHVLTMRVSLPPRAYPPAQAVQFFRDLATRLQTAPGVKSVAAMGWTPVVDGGGMWSIQVDGRVLKTISEGPTAQPQQVTPEFFAAMGMTLSSGRSFTEGDREDAPLVAVVNETMAKQLWPGQSALGHTIRMFNETAPWVTVVGVSRDIRSGGVQAIVPPTMFFPYAQTGKSAYFTPITMTTIVRTSGDPLALAGVARRTIRALDKTVPVSDVQTMEQVVGTSIAQRKFSTTLLAGFAMLALALTGIGIYGVISYGVSQRTYEIGLRMALGAERHTVLRLVVWEGLQLSLAGLALGLVGGVAIARFLRSLLVGVAVIDAPTLVVVAVGLTAVAVAASAVPARRAMGVSPTQALRGG